MKVLVSGGAGYVGSVTCAALIGAGHDVVVFDDLSSGHRAAIPSQAAFVQGDLHQLPEIRSAFDVHRPQAVLHFAGHIDVGESVRQPFKYLRDNVAMGLNLMQATVDAGVKRFVLSSTANLFGVPSAQAIDEHGVLSPGSPYGESKLYLERALHWLAGTQGLSSAALRYFNAAGATEERGEVHRPETHLIPLVLQTARGQRESIAIYGDDYDTPDGTCIRDYIHVADLAEAHVLALGATDRGFRSYNLGNGSGFSVKDVIEAARRITGRPIPSTIAARRPGDAPRLVADPRAILRDLGWKPRIPDLSRIIGTAWTWLQKHPDGY